MYRRSESFSLSLLSLLVKNLKVLLDTNFVIDLVLFSLFDSSLFLSSLFCLNDSLFGFLLLPDEFLSSKSLLLSSLLLGESLGLTASHSLSFSFLSLTPDSLLSFAAFSFSIFCSMKCLIPSISQVFQLAQKLSFSSLKIAHAGSRVGITTAVEERFTTSTGHVVTSLCSFDPERAVRTLLKVHRFSKIDECQVIFLFFLLFVFITSLSFVEGRLTFETNSLLA